MKRDFHPAAEAFPLLEGDELRALVDDIREHGLLSPILLDGDGRILDGRNRARACDELGTEPETTVYSGPLSPVELVVALNLHRRHLTASQRAAIAVDLLPHLEEEAAKRRLEGQKSGGRGRKKLVVKTDPEFSRARDVAAETLGVSSGYVHQARAVRREAPALFEEMRRGSISLREAQDQLAAARVTSSPAKPAPAPAPEAAPRPREVLDKALRALRAAASALRSDAFAHATNDPSELNEYHLDALCNHLEELSDRAGALRERLVCEAEKRRDAAEQRVARFRAGASGQ